MIEQSHADVAVVGGGVAGMVAANRLAQLGVLAMVLEQGESERYLCNSRYTGGTFHICFRDVMSDENALTQAIIESTAGFVPRALAVAIAVDGRRLVRWLQDEGARFMKASGAEYHRWVLAPPARSRPGLDWEGRGGDVLLRTLEANLLRRGGSVVRGARARSLLIADGQCRGVIAQRGGQEIGCRTRAVILADGGFQGNADLVKRHICARPERLKQRGAGTGRGDGLQMALDAGASVVGMDRFYGHVLSCDALVNDRLWPYPYVDSLATAGIVVGPAGERFVDEGRGGVYIANAIAQLADPLSATVIFDESIWEGPGRNGLIPANPHLPAVGGTLLRAHSLEALASELGIAASALASTVRSYNQALEAGTLISIAPLRSASRYPPRPIACAPFYAVPVCAGITNTMGGIAINEHAQALRTDGSPISGLYVAGAAAGGIEGGPALGYVGGLAKCGVTALRAAEHIARACGATPIAA
ncbi:MAG: FAD-binding protein [Betaproteobacteria bacterium]|nr:FAD-binding protein [Betaproteobacteria bacterium]